jgi:hypothetical protein
MSATRMARVERGVGVLEDHLALQLRRARGLPRARRRLPPFTAPRRRYCGQDCPQTIRPEGGLAAAGLAPTRPTTSPCGRGGRTRVTAWTTPSFTWREPAGELRRESRTAGGSGGTRRAAPLTGARGASPAPGSPGPPTRSCRRACPGFVGWMQRAKRPVPVLPPSCGGSAQRARRAGSGERKVQPAGRSRQRRRHARVSAAAARRAVAARHAAMSPTV